MLNRAELSSLASSLEDLSNRVTAMVGEAAGSEADADLLVELIALERALHVSRRRLNRALPNR